MLEVKTWLTRALLLLPVLTSMQGVLRTLKHSPDWISMITLLLWFILVNLLHLTLFQFPQLLHTGWCSLTPSALRRFVECRALGPALLILYKLCNFASRATIQFQPLVVFSALRTYFPSQPLLARIVLLLYIAVVVSGFWSSTFSRVLRRALEVFSTLAFTYICLLVENWAGVAGGTFMLVEFVSLKHPNASSHAFENVYLFWIVFNTNLLLSMAVNRMLDSDVIIQSAHFQLENGKECSLLVNASSSVEGNICNVVKINN